MGKLLEILEGTRPTSAGDIIRHSSAFLDELLSQPDLRRRAVSRLPTPSDVSTLQSLALLNSALDSSSPSSSSSLSPSPSSIRTAEKLLTSIPHPTPLSALLLALTNTLRRRPTPAALSLLDLFILDPSAARHDIAPAVFEHLFIPHLIPVLQWFAEQRSQLTSVDTPRKAEEDEGKSIEEVLATMSLLSRMSGGQAQDFKVLERGYEEVLDKNSRVYAEYLKEVLESADGVHEAPGPPELILMKVDDGGGEEGEGMDDLVEEEEEEDEMGSGADLKNRRYNPMWVSTDQSSGLSKRQNNSKGQHKSLKKCPTLFPQRVSHDALFKQPSKGNTKITSNLTGGTGPSFSTDDVSEDSFSEYNPDKEDNIIDIAYQIQNQSYSGSTMVDSDSTLPTDKQIPPKDFVCPITSQLFDDPVTLETGQTYVEERIVTVGILLRCMEEDGNCRDIIADKAELAPILESFATVSDVERFEIVQFFSELVKLNRRTFNEQLLHIIKDEGTYSTMHTLLVYLQTALEDEAPVIAGLLLQLDLLVHSRISIITKLLPLRVASFPETGQMSRYV